MQSSKIKEIMKKYKDVFDILENYDKTREFPIGRTRIDVTLDKRIIKKLRILKAKTGKPISRIIEEAVSGL
ncbi:ribbon-helix-helix domain-containing protein [Candidatus Pacearchaeota archaeon]|nr:ribbon-helix-helix domain-containing protein [Candidatus Pacearchaeota archaeon]